MSNQFILEPIFSKTESKFTTIDRLRSASIAGDRSGNERAVRLCKNANIFRNYSTTGQKTADIVRLYNFWLTFSFQVNFMYKNCM